MWTPLPSFTRSFGRNMLQFDMERRRANRLSVNLQAQRISGDEKHTVFIEDISESGIHIITAPSIAYKKYTPGMEINVRLQISPKEKITLHCKTRWSYHKMPPEKEVDSIGLEIIDPPLKYIEFIKALTSPLL
jgi:hypothetical protein